MTLKQHFVEFMRGASGRIARVAFGVAIAAAGLLAVGGTAGTVMAIFSVMPIASGLTGFCPLGPLFGVDFRGRERDARTASGAGSA